MLKAIILIGGPSKGTRFRPLSLDTPKPLFHIAGFPIIRHLIEACCRIQELKEILILGYYPRQECSDYTLINFIAEMRDFYHMNIVYLEEFGPSGTAGGMYQYREEICNGNPEGFFILNGDVCGDFPLLEMLDFFRGLNDPVIVVAATEATNSQSLNYGCIVTDKNTNEILHYVEKPSTFVSTLINCGVYLCSLKILPILVDIHEKTERNRENADKGDGMSNTDDSSSFEADDDFHGSIIHMETDVLKPLAGTRRAFAFQTIKWWSQIKSPGSTIYANRHYLELYRIHYPERLLGNECTPNFKIFGDVYVHPSARIHHTAMIGPNVSIGAGAFVGVGVRIRESIVLPGAHLGNYCIILHSVVGKRTKIGAWSRVEGTPCDLDKNTSFAKMDNLPLFNADGRLNPSITILGSNVVIPSEINILNSIVLPHKKLSRSFKNEIIL